MAVECASNSPLGRLGSPTLADGRYNLSRVGPRPAASDATDCSLRDSKVCSNLFRLDALGQLGSNFLYLRRHLSLPGRIFLFGQLREGFGYQPTNPKNLPPAAHFCAAVSQRERENLGQAHDRTLFQNSSFEDLLALQGLNPALVGNLVSLQPGIAFQISTGLAFNFNAISHPLVLHLVAITGKCKKPVPTGCIESSSDTQSCKIRVCRRSLKLGRGFFFGYSFLEVRELLLGRLCIECWVGLCCSRDTGPQIPR